jgi:hypothetical protein
VQGAGRGKGGITKLFGGGDGEDNVVRCEFLGHGNEVDGYAGWEWC